MTLCRPKKMTCRRPKKMTCRRPFQATATELRAESVGNVPAMDFEAADELQTTPLRDFARARMQEIYHKIRDAETNQTHGDAPEHSRIHSCATRHLVHRFIGMFSTLSKMILNDENEEDCADLHYKCKCIIQELRTKRDGSTVAAAEHDLIIEKISDLCVAKHINIVFEQLATEAQELATWATHHRQESSDYFKRIRDNSIEEIDATRSAAHPKQEPYVALALRAALREHIRKSTLNEL
jgi:hypothetical protein